MNKNPPATSRKEIRGQKKKTEKESKERKSKQKKKRDIMLVMMASTYYSLGLSIALLDILLRACRFVLLPRYHQIGAL